MFVMDTNTKRMLLDSATKERAEIVARIISEIPKEKEDLFLLTINAYLDGLITGGTLNDIKSRNPVKNQ